MFTRRGHNPTPMTPERDTSMARWPRHTWTTIITYLTIFGLFPLLCVLAWIWVRRGI